MLKNIDLQKFKEEPEAFSDFHLLITIKNFDLQSIRDRYLKSRNNTTGRVGSVERRKVGEGGIALIHISKGQMQSQEVLATMKEPRAIAVKGEKIAVGAEDNVYIIEGKRTQSIQDPWFSYIHTLDFHPNDNNTLLVSSSGFDCFFEYNVEKKKRKYSWFSWDYGLNKSVQNEEVYHLTRFPERKEELEEEGKRVQLIRDPGQGLPTSHRAAFINSVLYHPTDPSSFFLTLFHKGEVRLFNKETASFYPVMENLKSPHGGRLFKERLMVTDTANGRVVVGDEAYLFQNLPGKAKGLEALEWLQNSAVDEEGNIITIDSNRTSIIIYQPKTRKKCTVPYNNNWAIQDIIPIRSGQVKQSVAALNRLSREPSS